MRGIRAFLAYGIWVMACVSAVGCSSAAAAKEEQEVKKETIELIVSTPPLLIEQGNREADKSVPYTHFLEHAAELFLEQYKRDDVTIRVKGFDYTEEDIAIRQKFGTPEATDVLLEGFFNMGSYIHTGNLVPLDDLIDDKTRADISDRIWKEGVYQGKTYMYPFYHLPNTLVYNAELFREAGLDEYIAEKGTIANWSIEDWEIILDTLAEKLSGSTFPMMMYAKNNQGDTHIMVLLRAFGCPFFTDDGRFCVNTPEGIEALRWIQDGVSRGWFPPASENLELTDMMNLFRNGQLAVTVMNPSNITFFESSKLDARQVNFPSADGTGLSTTFVTGFGVFDNGDAEKIKIGKDFVKFVCESTELQEAVIPNIPVRISAQKRDKDKLFMSDAYTANESTLVNFTDNLPNWAGVRAVFYLQIHKLLTGEMTPEEAAAAIDRECNAAVDQFRQGVQ